MNKLKQLHESVGAVSKEIRTYLDSEARKAVADKAADPRLKDLEARYETLSAELDAEVRQHAREGAKQGSFQSLSAGEQRDVAQFDLGKVLRHMKRLATGGRSTLDGLEAELINEGEAEARAAEIEVSGIMLPRLLVRRNIERRDMTAGTASEGGNLVATDKMGLADGFYNASVLRLAGATVLENLQGNLDLPRYTKPSDPTKKAENASADELSPTVDKLSLTPRRLPAFIDLSDQLLRQSSSAIEAVVRKNLTEQMLAVQEVAFFHGGGTNEPTGIAATSGIGSVAGGTNGLAPAWSHIVDLESAVANVNAAQGRLAYLTNSKVRGKCKQVARNGAGSVFLFNDGMLNDVPTFVSNAVSSALTKGSSSGICSAIFYGNVADFYIGYWGGLQLELIRDSANAKLGLHTLVANSYYDGGVVRPASFAAMLDALTT